MSGETRSETGRETRRYEAEVGQLLDLMVRSLYSNKEIFLRELISNASDAADRLRFAALSDDSLTEGGGELRISIRFDPEARTLTVADNGIGIDPAHFDRIFQVFQRLHTRDVYEGTGIGLSVCRKIVERHGGTIQPESAKGQGTTFRFTLRAVEAVSGAN